MAGLTSSVASALSERSLSDVDLGSSVHSYMTPRRLSFQGNPTGECSRGSRNWKRPWCWVVSQAPQRPLVVQWTKPGF